MRNISMAESLVCQTFIIDVIFICIKFISNTKTENYFQTSQIQIAYDTFNQINIPLIPSVVYF